MRRRRPQPLPGPVPCALVGIAALALAVLTLVDGWRTAALTLAAAGAVLVTRIRFTPWIAFALVVAVAALSLLGHPLANSERPSALEPASEAFRK